MNSTGIQDWVIDNIIPILLLVIGLTIAAGFKTQAWGRVLTFAGVALVGLMIAVNPGGMVSLARELSNVVFS